MCQGEAGPPAIRAEPQVRVRAGQVIHDDAHEPEHAPARRPVSPTRRSLRWEFRDTPLRRGNELAVPETHAAAETLLRRTASGAGWVMAWRWGMRVLGLASTLVLVRLVAPADFGIIALATSFMQTIDGMLALGTEEAVIREHAPGRDFYDTAFTMNLLRGLSVTLLVGALAWPAAHFFDDARLGPVLLFVAVLPLLDGISNIGAVEFRRDFAFHKEFAIMVLPKLGGIIATIIAAILLRSYVAMLFGIGVNRTLRVVMSYLMHPYRPRLSLALLARPGRLLVLDLAAQPRDPGARPRGQPDAGPADEHGGSRASTPSAPRSPRCR